MDRRPAHRSRSAITDAYDLSAEAWITGPEPLYRKFAGELVHALASIVPGPLAGLKVRAGALPSYPQWRLTQ